MEDLLNVLYSAYTQPEMRQYVEALIKSGPEAMGGVQLQMTLTCSLACLIRVGERRDRLAPAHRAILERLLSDEPLRQGLKMLVAGVETTNEPVRLLEILEDHAPVVMALDERFGAMLDECGCSS